MLLEAVLCAHCQLHVGGQRAIGENIVEQLMIGAGIHSCCSFVIRDRYEKKSFGSWYFQPLGIDLIGARFPSIDKGNCKY
jgi:hypothetical protein